jgi:hypothetical protein
MLHFYKMGSHGTDLIISLLQRCTFTKDINFTFDYSVDSVQLLLKERKAGLERLASAAVVKGPRFDIRTGDSAWNNEK